MSAATPALAQSTTASTDGVATTQSGPDGTDQVSDIVVTGRRQAVEDADARKRNSDTIVDSVVADDAGKLPDNSITEVLQRVSGVSIVRFSAIGDPDHYSVEGSSVQVRGLTGVASRLNGREIFSANNGRALLWGDVTPELMAAVDVYKASTADLIAGGTGGQIDLRTKTPFDYTDTDFHVAATGDIGVGDMASKVNYSGSALISKKWTTGIGDIGILADFAYSKLSSLSQFIRVEPYFKQNIGGEDYFIPGAYTYGDEAFTRKRSGIYGAAQWAPSDSLTFTGIFFQSRYKNLSSDYGAFVQSQQFVADPATSTFDDQNGLVSSDALFLRDQDSFAPTGGGITSGGNKGVVRSNTVTRDYSLAFDWNPASSPLSLKGAIQRVYSTSKVDRLDVFREISFPSSFGLDLSGYYPQVTEPAGSQAIFDDPANYFWTASMPHNERNKGGMWAANLDAEYRLDSDFFKSVKVGGRWARRTERDRDNGFDWQPLGRGWNGDPQLTFANAAPGDVDLHGFKDFFRGQVNLPGNLMFPSFDLVSRMDREQLTSAPPAGFCTGMEYDCSAAGPVPETGYGGGPLSSPALLGPNSSTETWAGYALMRFGGEEGLGGNVGARVVHLKNHSEGVLRQSPTTFERDGTTYTVIDQAEERSGGASFTRVLPSVNINYTLADGLKFRASYNITMDLPSFRALRASGTVGVATTTNPAGSDAPPLFTNFTTDSGEPALKPAMSNNFDLSFEYYGRPGTTFHFAPFYKRITNLAVFSITQRQRSITYADGTTEVVNATASDYSNATKAATVKGFEVGGHTYFDRLPGWLSGIGIEANYTFIDSSNPGDLYRDINGVEHNDVPLVGLSKHNFNVALLYEKDPVSLRVAYSWRSRYLLTTNSNGTNPTYSYYSAPGVSTPIQIALPIYGDHYGTLDAGARFKVTDNFSFNIQGTNLTASTQHTLMGGYNGGKVYGRSWFQTDRRITTGISLAF